MGKWSLSQRSEWVDQVQIKTAINVNSSLYTIFFDLEQAFPRVWRHYISQKLHKLGLRGNLPNLLQSFRYDRVITVSIEDKVSTHVPIGVPQGEIWSVPHFQLAINDINNRLLTTSVCPSNLVTHLELQDSFNKPSTSYQHGQRNVVFAFLHKKQN